MTSAEINTKHLAYDKSSKTFSAEVSSTMGYLTSNMVYVISERTGNGKHFVLVNERRDREFEIVAFEFECRADPSIKLVLWND